MVNKTAIITAALLLAVTSTASTFPFSNNEASVTASADFDEDASITPSDNYLNAMLGSNDSILTVDETKFPTGAILYGIFTTERADSTGDIGIYPGYTDFNMMEINKRSDWAACKVISDSSTRVTNQYKLEYGAVPYCFLRERTTLGDTIYRFDVENQTIDTSKHWENNSMISITLDEETFPMMKGCNGVEIYGKELDDGNNDDVENEGETKIKLKYSADELFSESGSKIFSYRINWNTPSRMCRVRFLFDDGYVEYSVITEDVYLNRDTRNVSSYKVTDENGNLVDEGELSDGVFDSLDDLNLSEEDLREKGTYFYYETESGVKNSTEPDALKKESGCFTVTEDGTLHKEELSSNLKGDVNMDGELTVSDVIMLQKYLLKTESFTLGNYVNADTYVEGNVNAFDLAMLKHIIVNN